MKTKKTARTNSVAIQFYTDKATAKALSAYLDSLPAVERPTRRAVMEAGLHQFLAGKGFWKAVQK